MKMTIALAAMCLMLISTTAYADARLDALLERAADHALAGENEKFFALVDKHHLLGMLHSNGDSPMISATMMNADLIKDLVDRGASIEGSYADGITPLHVAAVFGYPKAVSVLLKLGANPNATTNGGQNALIMAFSGMMTGAQRPDNQPGQYKKVSSLLINAGSNINEVDASGATLLLIAVMTNNIPFTQYFLKNGADMNRRVQDEITILEFARRHVGGEIVTVLEKHARRRQGNSAQGQGDGNGEIKL